MTDAEQMESGRFLRLIDCGFSSGLQPAVPGVTVEQVPLMPDSGEYCTAIRRLSGLGPDGPAGRGVPDEIFLHLYAYELLERMRDRARYGGDGTAELHVLPFWPESLFHAAGQPVHGSTEIMALAPTADLTWYVRRPPAVVEAEARRVLGDLRFDPDAYVEALEATAAGSGWICIGETE